MPAQNISDNIMYMSNILFISNNSQKISKVETIVKKHGLNFQSSCDEEEIFALLEINKPDVILLDMEANDLHDDMQTDILAKRLKVLIQADNILLILLIENDYDNIDALKTANACVVEPINENILISTINSNLKIKKSLDILSKNNSELARSLYQLDVLYNTSSQFSGSLDKNKLIDIMLEGLEKSLSFSLSYTLIFNEKNDAKIIINSLHPLSTRLEQSIKVRALLSYQNLFEKKHLPYDVKLDDIKLEKRVKHQFNEYDLNVFNFDNMFSPIHIGDNFFGIIEIFRETEFASEDATCFQTLSRQVSLPLESAILYEQIQNTNKKLEKLERLKSEFISIVSHELRTPLTAIKNSLDIILSGKSGELSTSMSKFLDMAKRNVTRLSGIINDLLDLSKVEAGKMDFRFKKTDINVPVEFVKNTFENLAKEKNINLEIELDKNLPDVYIDAQRMEQIISNLVSNALKFTEDNGKISIKTQKISAANVSEQKLFEQDNSNVDITDEYVLITVKDSGIGISKENLNKVFDKFAQIESSLSRAVGGSGLGLPIAKELTTAHHGFIWLESVMGEGTTFFVAIPVLNKKKIFEIDLDVNVAKAKQKHSTLGLIMLKENTDCENSLIDAIQNEKISIIRKTPNTIDFSETVGLQKTLIIAINEADKFALSFVDKKLQTEVKQNQENIYQKCDILFSSALYPDDALSVCELLKKAEENLRKL